LACASRSATVAQEVEVVAKSPGESIRNHLVYKIILESTRPRISLKDQFIDQSAIYRLNSRKYKETKYQPGFKCKSHSATHSLFVGPNVGSSCQCCRSVKFTVKVLKRCGVGFCQPSGFLVLGIRLLEVWISAHRVQAKAMEHWKQHSNHNITLSALIAVRSLRTGWSPTHCCIQLEPCNRPPLLRQVCRVCSGAQFVGDGCDEWSYLSCTHCHTGHCLLDQFGRLRREIIEFPSTLNYTLSNLHPSLCFLNQSFGLQVNHDSATGDFNRPSPPLRVPRSSLRPPTLYPGGVGGFYSMAEEMHQQCAFSPTIF
jgi:hypothetical protein